MNAMTPLGELIEEAQSLFEQTHGIELTYGDIARRSKGRLSRQRVQQLAKDPIKAMPTPDVLYGLALGLTVPESVVLERALASAGYTGPRKQRRDESADAATNRQAPTGAAPETPEQTRARVTAEKEAKLRAGLAERRNGRSGPPE